MGKMIRPNDPLTVTRSGLEAFYNFSRTRLHIAWLKLKRRISKFACARLGHKAGGKEVKMPDDSKMTICPRCGFYQD